MRRIILVFVVLVLFISCHKSTDPLHIPQVRRLMFFRGNVNNIDFAYDNLGRVISIDNYDGNSPVNVPLTDSIFTIKFEYTGNNMLPASFTIRHYWQQTVETHYISYDADNRPVKDSTQFGVERTYEYQSSKLVIRESLIGPHVYTHEFVKANAVRVYRDNTLLNTYDYDNGINPLHYLNIAPVAPVINYSHSPYFSYWSIWSFSGNNLVKIAGSNNDNLSYTYYADGLPDERYWYHNRPASVDTVDAFRYIYQ